MLFTRKYVMPKASLPLPTSSLTFTILHHCQYTSLHAPLPYPILVLLVLAINWEFIQGNYLDTTIATSHVP